MTRNFNVKPGVRIALPYSRDNIHLIITALNGFNDYGRTSRAKKGLEQKGTYSAGGLTLKADGGTLHVSFNGKHDITERLFERSGQAYLGEYFRAMMTDQHKHGVIN